MISEDVLSTIVANAVAEVDGVAGLGIKPSAELSELVSKKAWGKSLKVLIAEDNSISIDCGLMIRYGYSVVDVATAVQQAVTANVESTTGVKVTEVNVNICGIVR